MSEYRTPPREQAYRTPPREQVYRTPPREQVYSTPPREQAYSTPPREQAYSTPPREQVYRTPPREQAYSTPRRDPAVASLTRRVAQAIVESEPPVAAASRLRRSEPQLPAKRFRGGEEVGPASGVYEGDAGIRVLEIRQRREGPPRAARLFSLEGTHLRFMAEVDTHSPLDLRVPGATLLPAPSSEEFLGAVQKAYAGCNDAGWHLNVCDGRDVTVAPHYLRGLESALYISFGPAGPEEVSRPAIGGLVYVHRTRTPNTEEINWVCKPLPPSEIRMHALLRSVLVLRLEENAELQQFRLDVVGSERARPLYERVGFVPMPGGDDDEMVVRRETLLS